jgi:hypothetical protein
MYLEILNSTFGNVIVKDFGITQEWIDAYRKLGAKGFHIDGNAGLLNELHYQLLDLEELHILSKSYNDDWSGVKQCNLRFKRFKIYLLKRLP